MIVDWMVLATVVAAVAAVFGVIVLPIVGWKHKTDWARITALKADSDQKIEHNMELSKAMKADSDSKLANLDRKIADVYTNVQAKLDKSEHQIALARIDKELESVRRDQKDDFARIEAKIDRVLDHIIVGGGRVSK
jgi:ribosome-associated translation inhibitor RaiA